MKTIQHTFTNVVTIQHIFSEIAGLNQRRKDIFLMTDKEITYILSLELETVANRTPATRIATSDLCPCCISDGQRKTISDIVEAQIADGTIKGKVVWTGDREAYNKIKDYDELVAEHYDFGEYWRISQDGKNFLEKEAFAMLEENS